MNAAAHNFRQALRKFDEANTPEERLLAAHDMRDDGAYLLAILDKLSADITNMVKLDW